MVCHACEICDKKIVLSQYVQRGKRMCEQCVQKSVEKAKCLECGKQYPMIHFDSKSYPGCPCYDDMLSESSFQSLDNNRSESDLEEKELEDNVDHSIYSEEREIK
jgi:hypothetical protein